MLATIVAASTIPAADHVRPNLALLHALTEARGFGVPAYAVASAAGVSPALLSMIARGRVRATDQNAHAIAQALGRSTAELFPAAASSATTRSKPRAQEVI